MKKADLLSAILFLNILLFYSVYLLWKCNKKKIIYIFMAMTCCALLGIVIVEFIKRKKVNK